MKSSIKHLAIGAVSLERMSRPRVTKIDNGPTLKAY